MQAKASLSVKTQDSSQGLALSHRRPVNMGLFNKLQSSGSGSYSLPDGTWANPS